MYENEYSLGPEALDQLRAYSIKDFSELVGVPQTTLRKWEEVLGEAFRVPRDAQNQRFYTKKHELWVAKINKWRDEKDLGLPLIKELLLEMQSLERDNPQFETNANELAIMGQQGGLHQNNQLADLSRNFDDKIKLVVSHMEDLLYKFNQENREFLKEELSRIRNENNDQIENIEKKLTTVTKAQEETMRSLLEENTAMIKNSLTKSENQKSDEERSIELRQALHNELALSRRVHQRLRMEAIEAWNKNPVKTGLFKKKEDLSAKTLFIEEFIANRIEEEYKKEIT
ncbi:hypothetical protein B1A99_24705 [Cohnella sp. CIP 111063]|uniref:helix-turn-helix domain-containing protein n=1 Tax=unclassified Cohnella TaxID=2636738 RepID=UPI000B8BC16D|nr:MULTISPECIES: helix-turn-helix domain-containing protein [unclassified Cohnella]OXS54984.1 hypothetical protein B1A99_24705 [Cohnella sp. CIP 111063]PRX65124.1 MerR-like DNA binding protein [Cohnella sp. SGD-V74]